MNLIEQRQFDTVYHEHFSYLSLGTVNRIFLEHGLKIFDVEEIAMHGGSLRVYAQREDTGTHQVEHRVDEMLTSENLSGMMSLDYYRGFQEHAEKVKNNFVSFLIEQKEAGKLVVGYGAAAKGSTLLNFAGVKSDLVPYVVDRNPHKQGKFMPGSRIPIVDEECLKSDKPAYVVIFPWNLREEVISQLDYLKSYGTKIVIAVPKIEVI